MSSTAAPDAGREPVRELNPSDMRQVADTIPDDAFDFEMDDDGPPLGRDEHDEPELSAEERKAAEGLDLGDQPEDSPKDRQKRPQDGDEDEEATEAEAEDEEAQADENGEDEPEQRADADKDKDEAKDAKPDRLNLRDDTTIVIDGQEVSGAEVKRGFLRQADYTRKTQEVAQIRQQVQQEQERIRAQEGELSTILDLATDIVRQALPKPPDPNLIDVDERAYLRAQANYHAELQKFEKLVQARQTNTEQMTAQQRAAQAELQQRQAQAQQAQLQNEIRLMQERIPALRTREGWNNLYADVEKYGGKYGITPQDVASIQKTSELEILMDALELRKLRSATPAVVKKAQAAPPIRPAARPASGTRTAAPNRSAEEAFRRNPNARTAAATLPDSLFE